MKAKISSILFLLTISAFIVGGVCSVCYIFRSRYNPHLLEIIIGSILISLIVGILPILIQKFIEKQAENRTWISFGTLCCCLIILVAIIVYSSNIPKDIHQEIPVTYLVNLNTMDLPFGLYGLRFDSETTSYSYDDVRHIFKSFKNKNPENIQKIKEMLQGNSVDTSGFNIACFQNLTEYLIPYYIGFSFSGPDLELPLYRGESTKFLAWPHPTIRGEPKPLDRIKGEFNNNLFYGIELLSEFHKEIKLRLPKNTEMLLTRTNRASSAFVIKNKYLEIKIEVWYLLGSSGYYTLPLPDSAFRFHETYPLKEQEKGPLKHYNAIISYNVNFNKLRYSFPEMKYYEEWANNLLSLLQRKFLWGSPAYLNNTE